MLPSRITPWGYGGREEPPPHPRTSIGARARMAARCMASEAAVAMLTKLTAPLAGNESKHGADENRRCCSRTPPCAST